MKRIYTLVALALAIGAQTASAELSFNDVFPVTFDKGMPAGWALDQKGTYEIVERNLKVTCPQEAPNYRTDLKYNMVDATDETKPNFYFTMDASKYKVFAITFVGTRPQSGALKLSNIGVQGVGWIKGVKDYNLNETGWKDIEGNDGNHTYYWTIGGNNWSGEKTITEIEIVIADIKNDADKTYTIKDINWYNSVAELKHTLGITQDNIADATVNNSTYNIKYANLSDAWNEAGDNNTLEINHNQELGTRLNCDERSITLKGGNEGVTITRTNAANMMFLSNKNGYSLTLENLTLDGNNTESSANFIEASGYATVNLNNVDVKNAQSTNGIGLIVAKGGGKLVINNLVTENCKVNENVGEVFFGTSYCQISGRNNFSLSVEKQNNFTVEGTLNNIEPITVYNYNGTFAVGNTLAKNCTDPEQFKLGNVEGLMLTAKDGNLVIDKETGVAEIENVANEAVEYFNLQGVRVLNPENGIFIRKQGSKVSKVIINK